MRHYKPCGCYKKCTCGYPTNISPTQQMPAKTMPTQYSPTKQFNEYVGQDVYVPVVHPSHTTKVNHTTYKYMHSYPHTQSVVNSASEEHYCVCPPKQQHCGCKPKHFW